MKALQKVNTGKLQFGKITVNEAYQKEWQCYDRDFVLLCRGEEPLRNTLYRIGGMGSPKLNVDEYFMLIKHVEAFYTPDILRMAKSTNPKHLAYHWVIIDKNGDEKVVFNEFASPYLVKDSCIYHENNKYYNIETQQLYCQSFTHMESDEFLFLNNAYDDDKSKRGVMKINKKDGTFELFPGK